MQKGIHFISGLPRSGSTLLAALLRQNPRFHAGMSSPVLQMYAALEGAMSGRNDYHLFIDEDQRRALLRGVFESYYARIHARQVVFDTNRVWSSRISGLVQLFPGCRVICCVRDVAWIVDSFERLVQRSPFTASKIFNFDSTGNVYSRTEMLTGNAGVLRVPLDALRQAFYGEHACRLLLVTFESLTRNPESTLRRVYEFIGEDFFAHDFEHVTYSADVFDQSMCTPGLHTVSGPVSFVPRPTVLPPDIVKRFQGMNFWVDPRANPRGVQIL